MAYKSSIVTIGNIDIGSEKIIRTQSMTTTNTMNTVATVNQIISLSLAGCDFVRVTTQNVKEAENLKNIKQKLNELGVNIPIIADVHYNPKVAEVAAKIAEKVRINPGNYVNNRRLYSEVKIADDICEINEIEQNIVPLLNICKQYETAIRIGVNHGSLSNRILCKFGNTAIGMVESIMEFVNICHKNEFSNLVLSLKASNVAVMIEANMLLVKQMKKMGFTYPIHLGVTEAGSEDEGRIKSAAGIGYLLTKGIGDTIRVSLTEDPILEIPVALQLVKNYGQKTHIKLSKNEIIQFNESIFDVEPPIVITSAFSRFSDLSMQNNMNEGKPNKEKKLSILKLNYDGIPYNELVIKATVDASVYLLDHNIDGLWIDNKEITSADKLAKLTLSIFQVFGLRITKTEFIACPTCGRSTINVIKQLTNVKQQTGHLSGIKIAIMGCVVNGPGEMNDAHYGYVGSGIGKVDIYKDGDVAHKNVQEKFALDTLIDIIKANGDWQDNEL